MADVALRGRGAAVAAAAVAVPATGVPAGAGVPATGRTGRLVARGRVTEVPGVPLVSSTGSPLDGSVKSLTPSPGTPKLPAVSPAPVSTDRLPMVDGATATMSSWMATIAASGKYRAPTVRFMWIRPPDDSSAASVACCE